VYRALLYQVEDLRLMEKMAVISVGLYTIISFSINVNFEVGYCIFSRKLLYSLYTAADE
jgi:hypothetical protein